MKAYQKKSKPIDLLRQQRQERGWTLDHAAEELARLCESKASDRGEINGKMIGRWERGEHLPSLYYQEKLQLLFGKSLRELGFIPPGAMVDIKAEESEHISAHKSTPLLQRSTVNMTPHQAIDLLQGAPHLTSDQLVGAWLALGATELATVFDQGWTLEEVLTSLRNVLQGIQAMSHISRRTFGHRMRELITAAVASQLPMPTG